jgi:hypothetical protein
MSLSKIHQRLGTAGFVISIVALVAALGGGAYAASGKLTGKQKKEVQKIAKQYAGKPGANGTNGTNGAPGPKGDTGSAGSNGTDGTNGAPGAPGTDGKSVEATTIAPGEIECDERGGTEFKDGSGASTYACNGEEGPEGPAGPEGSPWTAGGTLPSGKTETGGWAFGTVSEGAVSANLRLAVSFPIPLAAELAETNVHFINKAGKEVILNGEGFPEEVTPTSCGSALSPAGTAKAPAAAPGHLCVYARELSDAFGFSNNIFKLGSFGLGASTAGAMLEFIGISEGATGWGSWAVTAP